MELEIILAVIGSNAVFSFIQFLISRHDRKKNHISENDKNQSDMILGLGHDKLLFLTDKFVSRGVITMKEKRNLDYLYKPYEKMGGNGDCKIGYDACQELRIVSEEEALKIDGERKKKDYGL